MPNFTVIVRFTNKKNGSKQERRSSITASSSTEAKSKALAEAKRIHSPSDYSFSVSVK